MSLTSKSSPSLNLISDILLGSVGSAIPPSEELDHAVRFFGTWSGSDKLMMTTQYSVKLLIPLLQLRHRIKYRHGGSLNSGSSTIEGLNKFTGHLSVARRVSGFWGILAVMKGLSALERSSHASLAQLNLQRIQGISMLIFYPLEYISFFSSPLAPVLYGVSASKSLRAQIWSIRTWGAYVVLQIVLLGQEWKELVRKERSPTTGIADVKDNNSIRKRKRAITYQLLANIFRLPVILHWSVVGGIYNGDMLTNILSFISSLAALRGGWESTSLPASH